MRNNIRYIYKMSGTLAVGNIIGTNIGELHIISHMGGDLYGTNKGIYNIQA